LRNAGSLALFDFGKSSSSNLLVFAKGLKQKTAFSFKRETGSRLWQKNYYDHVLRTNEEANHVAGYIWMNPVRKGLCKNFEDYPFSRIFHAAVENFFAV
jgi:putative transposase